MFYPFQSHVSAYLAALSRYALANMLGLVVIDPPATRTQWAIRSRSLGLVTVLDLSLVDGFVFAPVRYNPLIVVNGAGAEAFSLTPNSQRHMWLELRVTSSERPDPFRVYFDPSHAQLDGGVYLFEADPRYRIERYIHESPAGMESMVARLMMPPE